MENANIRFFNVDVVARKISLDDTPSRLLFYLSTEEGPLVISPKGEIIIPPKEIVAGKVPLTRESAGVIAQQINGICFAGISQTIDYLSFVNALKLISTERNLKKDHKDLLARVDSGDAFVQLESGINYFREVELDPKGENYVIQGPINYPQKTAESPIITGKFNLSPKFAHKNFDLDMVVLRTKIDIRGIPTEQRPEFNEAVRRFLLPNAITINTAESMELIYGTPWVALDGMYVNTVEVLQLGHYFNESGSTYTLGSGLKTFSEMLPMFLDLSTRVVRAVDKVQAENISLERQRVKRLQELIQSA